MIDIVGHIFAGMDLGGAGESRIGIADRTADHALRLGIAHMIHRRLHGSGRIRLRTRRVAPLRLQLVARDKDRLDGRADNADAMIERDGIDDPRHGFQLVAIERGGARTAHWRARDRAVKKARHAHVDGIGHAAGRFRFHVAARHILADEAEIGDWLELFRLDFRQLLRRFGAGGNLAVGEFASAARMNDRVRLGGQLACRHIEARGGRVDQHLARLRARRARRHPISA